MNSDPKASILIVEDERIVARDIQEAMTDAGYDVIAIASSAEEVFTVLRERRPDVILMDIRIRGDRDGMEVAKEVRERYRIPVIYLTAHADEATLDRARRTEPYGYLLKPVKIVETRIAVEIALYKSKLERRERERERWHTTTLECVADAVISVDGGGITTFMNRAAEELLGITRGNAVGFPIADTLRLSSALADGPPHSLDPETLERLGDVEHVLLRRADGKRCEVRVRPAKVVDDGAILGTVIAFHDVTDERRIQRQVDRAERMNTVSTMLFGLVVHVNNCLAVVAANTSFAMEELAAYHLAPSEAGRDLVARLLTDTQSAAARIQKLIVDLRAFAHAPTDKLQGPSDVSEAIQSALGAASGAFASGARVETQLAEGLSVGVERQRLVQMFLNLIINAAQAIEQDEREAHVVSIRSRAVDGSVVVEVQDSGVGIPEDVRERIFEPFFSTREVGAGVGLGLAVCTRIAASVGGTIEVASGVQRGALLRVTLPSHRSAG